MKQEELYFEFSLSNHESILDEKKKKSKDIDHKIIVDEELL